MPQNTHKRRGKKEDKSLEDQELKIMILAPELVTQPMAKATIPKCV